MCASAETTAVSAWRLPSISAVPEVFQPKASKPAQLIAAAPASAPRQNGFHPAGKAAMSNLAKKGDCVKRTAGYMCSIPLLPHGNHQVLTSASHALCVPLGDEEPARGR